MVEFGLDLSGSGLGRVADACKYSCENVIYITVGKFLDYMS